MTITLDPVTGRLASGSAATRGNGAPVAAPAADSSDAVLRAIETRRSAPAWLPEAPPRELVERVLDAGNRAPNHKLTQPWRFFVLRGDARLEYASARASDQIAFQSSRVSVPSDAWATQCREMTAQNLLRAPLVIAVGCQPAQLPDLPDWEELAAASAAVQNMLLAAHALGLGAAWKSRSCPLPGAVAWLGLPPHAQLIGHVLLGYADPAVPLKPKVRRPHPELTSWLGWG